MVTPMDSDRLPIACTLTATDRQERGELLQRVGAALLEVRELESGYAYRFPAGSRWLDELITVIRLERDCCQFLKFGLIAEPGSGPIWLELTGPSGTKEFLAGFFR
jgi:hypothetical protein